MKKEKKLKKNKKNLSPLRKKFDEIETRGKIRKLREKRSPLRGSPTRTKEKRMY